MNMCKYIHYKMYDEITYPFPNFNGATVEVLEWISNFIHTLLGMWLLIHAGITVKQISKRGYRSPFTNRDWLKLRQG